MIDTGSSVSLLPIVPNLQNYDGPQDLLAVNQTRLTVHGLKTLNVHLGLAQSYSWTFKVAEVPFGIIGCDFLSFYGLQVDMQNKRLVEPEQVNPNPTTDNFAPCRTAEPVVSEVPQSIQKQQPIPIQEKQSPPIEETPPEFENPPPPKSNSLPSSMKYPHPPSLPKKSQRNPLRRYLNLSQTKKFPSKRFANESCSNDEPLHDAKPQTNKQITSSNAQNETQTDIEHSNSKSISQEPQAIVKQINSFRESGTPNCSNEDKIMQQANSEIIDKRNPDAKITHSSSKSLLNEQNSDTTFLDKFALTKSLISEYKEVFKSSINTTKIKHGVSHHIVTTGPPVKSRVRRLSPERLQFVKDEIDQLLADGILVPSSSPYASPIHIVPKSEPGKFRMVGDYRALNNATQPDRYPLPFLNDFSDSLHGCTVFSKLDCYKGYHQIPMAKEDAHKTAIITPIGLYQYTMMPFGLRNAGNTYQRYMDELVRNLPFCFVYADDVLVASHSNEEHKQHLRLLLDRFKQNGVVLNKNKCEFAVSKLNFLGHHISTKGFEPIPEKVQAIQNFPKPRNVKELRRFLGMVNFYRRFIPSCSDILAPLNRMLSPGKNSKKLLGWSVEAVAAFLKIKNKLSEAALLTFPTPNAETAIFVDASESGCGGVLQQKTKGTNCWKPLSFFSHSFTITQSRYSTFDRELLAIYLAIKHFRYFVEGRTFTVFTDHAPLCKAIFSRSQTSSPRQQRHLDYIAQFTSDLRHIKGQENVVADCLSRVTASVFEESEPINFLEMAAAQQRDATIAHLQSSSNSLKLEYQLMPNQGVSILGDTSTRKFRPLVPLSFRKKIFDSVHNLSHPGIKASQTLISRRYAWPGLKADVKQWCSSCILCQQSKIQRHTISPLQPLSSPTQKFQHIHVDIVGPLPISCDHKYLLTIVDRFSRWFEAIPLKDIAAKSCADAFILNFVSRYGAPQTMTTDRGRQFTSNLWKELAKFLGCDIIQTTAYNPKANGLVERYHRVLKASLKSQTYPGDWYKNLGWILLGIRATVREDLEHSPAEMVYGTSLRLPGEYFANANNPPSSTEYMEQLQQFVQNLKPVPTRKKDYRKMHVDQKLSTCSHVFVRHDAVRVGLQRPYDGPFKVLQRSKKYFKLNQNGIIDNVSIDRLKPANLLDSYNCDILSGDRNSFQQSNQSSSPAFKQKQQTDRHNTFFQFTESHKTTPKQASPPRISRKGREIRKPERYCPS